MRRTHRGGFGAAAGVLLVAVVGCWGGAGAQEPALQSLAVHAGEGQPVFARTQDGRVLVAQAAERPVHPASVSKVATTLALLRELGPAYRFETKLLAAGPVRDGRIDGDLVVQGGRDPFLVYEGAYMMLRRLYERGIRSVGGQIVLRGPLLFNWQPDADGQRFAAALAGRDETTAWNTVAALPGPPVPDALDAIALRVLRGAAGGQGEEHLLATHRSPPLVHVVKTLNGYSNNVFHLVAPQIGGVETVERIARDILPSDYATDEVILQNGAGAGTTNRLSARAAVAIEAALAAEAARHKLTLTDLLPVSGIDPGTLEDRLLDHRAKVIGKTGTYGDVGASALCGALRTRRYGVVYFAVLNSWVPVPEARKRQDAFVRALIDATEAEPWPYDRPVRPAFTAAEVR